MDKRENILEAWIMVEHLSEGDIKLNDNLLKKLEIPKDRDYYSLLNEEIQGQNLSNDKGGIVLYFNTYPFSTVIQLLREKYNLSETDDEVSVGDKFSFALYFDKELKLQGEMTFFTASYYILQNNSIPQEKDFLKFEKENKENINSIFACPEEEDYIAFFNKAFTKLLNQYSIQTEKTRMKALNNLETDATNLHSFFVDDLEKAKSIKARNLECYLSGENESRINLNSKANTQGFNPAAFEEILQAKNYPLSRFPANPKFSLSLMQQLAVNLAIQDSNEKIRSVNGPPGTGKTTLLKDVFAELLVEQAYEIAKLADKDLSKMDRLNYYDKAYIAVMPSVIAEKEIIVASSNNGAVQNIVKELPLINKVDESFVDKLRDADYFWEISNAKLSMEWIKKEVGNYIEVPKAIPYEDEKHWGLFSLEGGKKENMSGIITALKHVENYLYNAYESSSDVYARFLEKYRKQCKYKEERQRIAENHAELLLLQKEIEFKCIKLEKKRKELECEFKAFKEKNNADSIKIKQESSDIEGKMASFSNHIEKILKEKENIHQAIQALQLQKPSWFQFAAKKEFKEKMRCFSEELLELLAKEKELNLEYSNLKEGKRRITKALKENEEKLSCKRKENDSIIQLGNKEIRALSDKINALSMELERKPVQRLDMYKEYDALQLSNPWFDEEYRVLQSELFIEALKVRKQFLYENRKSIKAAYRIWSRQKEYLEKKEVIRQAWNWINMVIPVIGSTFASFSRMCENLGEGSLGYLFVDEAGQALPQAAVGALFRSKQVMVVGDPAQIKPVLTLDPSILAMLGKHYGVSNKYLSDSASVQTLVDAISKFGFYKDEDEWIGIPLWVHRRCKNPMFNISNAISYGGNMVQSTAVPGKASWYDVKGNATDKYVKEQGDFLKEKILELIKQNPNIVNKGEKDLIYVISPFRNVAYQLSQKLREINFTRYGKDGKPSNIGTVHTFQGKEADIVFLVLGCDEKSRGAASWAVGTDNPNIMNVAATRAKEEFYIIGNRKLYNSINSEVIHQTNRVLQEFNGIENA